MDGAPRLLAGLWNAWADKKTGEIVERYTMPTINADDHPNMSRTHKPDSKLAPHQQDKRSVAAIEASNAKVWLSGPNEAASKRVRPPDAELIDGGPSIELRR